MFNFKIKKINNLFYIFVSTHIVIWTFIPSITNINLPLDTIEALAWGSNLDWGFSKHPPMSAFFVEVFYKIFGAQDWAYYLLSQIFVISSFFIIFKFSEEIFKNKVLSLLSVLLLEGIYFYNFTTPEFNVNVCQLPFWALTVFFAWKIFNQKKLDIKNFIYLGVFSAIGFLSKYLFVYLLFSIFLMFAYLILIKKERKFDFKYLVSFEIFIVLLIPHVIWLFNNDFVTFKYGLDRTGVDQFNIIDHLKLPTIFLLKQIGILIPFFILLFLIIKKIKFKLNLKDEKVIFLLFINLTPIILMLLTSLLFGLKIRTMWMTPFYLFFGVLFIYVLKNQLNFDKFKKFLIAFFIIFFTSPFSYAYISLIKKEKRTDYPGKEIANEVQKQWNKDFSDEINAVLGNEWEAGNLSYHLKSRPKWYGKVDSSKLESLNKFICIDEICIGTK
tara:strand:+ start:1328 stop:2653 length:1326 start_codon:yes stop_codon:yes gene_type:complete